MSGDLWLWFQRPPPTDEGLGGAVVPWEQRSSCQPLGFSREARNLGSCMKYPTRNLNHSFLKFKLLPGPK